jgi:hypothetical protein
MGAVTENVTEYLRSPGFSRRAVAQQAGFTACLIDRALSVLHDYDCRRRPHACVANAILERRGGLLPESVQIEN